MAAKKAEKGEKIDFGRVGNTLRMGLVGLPNVGKSSTFNLLTKLSVPAENFPFCTIDPHVARVEVQDERFDWLVAQYKPGNAVRAVLSITDIAGLVKGASTGEGMGNHFLSHIKAVDGIFHVVRLFEDAEVTHEEGNVDPIRDLDIIMEELRAKDVESTTKAAEAIFRVARGGDKQKKFEHETYTKILECLEEKKDIRSQPWKIKEIDVIRELNLFAVKPRIFLANMGKKDYLKKKNKWGAKFKEWVQQNGNDPIIPYSVAVEEELLASDGTSPANVKSSLPRIIKTGYQHLNLQYFFTCGEKEVKCWTIRKGSKAPKAGGVIHSDFEQAFVKAEIMAYDDLHEHGSEAAVKAAGKYHTKGKEYVVKDGDIILFKVGQVNKGKKK